KSLYYILKNAFEKFPLTILTVIILTLISVVNIDNNFIPDEILGKIFYFGIIFASSNFLIETKFEENIKKRRIAYIIAAIISLIFTLLLDIDTIISGTVDKSFNLTILRWTITYCVIINLAAIYFNFKRSGKTFEEYVTTVFVNNLKNMIIYGILAIGALIVSAVFIYLILNGKGYMFILRVETLIFGMYYIPTIIYAFYDMEKEHSKFFKIVIKNILDTLVIIAFAIIYMYIIKIIILRQIPSNEIFRILMGLFILGCPIWTMAQSFNENKLIDKINSKLPLLFIPFIFLQMYSIGVRIISHGVTEFRYLAVMLIIFEIIYIFMYLKKKEKIENILLILSALTAISLVIPFINMFNISAISQYNYLKIVENKSEYSDEEKQKINGAYSYFKTSVYGDKYLNKISSENIEKIKNMKKEVKINDNYIYATADIKSLDVEGYNKLYEISSNRYSNSYSTFSGVKTNIKETFKDIEIELNDNKNIKVNLSSEIQNYFNHKDKFSEYFKNNYEIKLDNERKLVLKHISIYLDEDENVESYSFTGYLLEK
ncbi:MAG: DUF4153 domain-containing protein, partial [Clostridia bacterium]|nr:DUF4153 domain-containing protein [Clostridia bacterium]